MMTNYQKGSTNFWNDPVGAEKMTPSDRCFIGLPYLLWWAKGIS